MHARGDYIILHTCVIFHSSSLLDMWPRQFLPMLCWGLERKGLTNGLRPGLPSLVNSSLGLPSQACSEEKRHRVWATEGRWGLEQSTCWTETGHTYLLDPHLNGKRWGNLPNSSLREIKCTLTNLRLRNRKTLQFSKGFLDIPSNAYPHRASDKCIID